MAKLLAIFGTRPEAIKMAPLLLHLSKQKGFESVVCITAQHRKMLDQVLEFFNIEVDFDLDLMVPNQTLSGLTCKIINGLESVLEEVSPDLVLVHGDTTTAFAASLAAFYKKIPIGHVEAGLRTNNLYSPWPEEGNRKLISSLANYHFCPTENARANLLSEGISPEAIVVTGNTVVDSLTLALNAIASDLSLSAIFKEKFKYLDFSKKLILVTGHRRESFGEGFENICLALKKLAIQNDDVQIIYPVHLNPSVQVPVSRVLGDIPNVFLIEPVDYVGFVYLMSRSYLILTDSGGIQEEAPTVGVPLFVMRESTERPEALLAGSMRLVGSSESSIFSEVMAVLKCQKKYQKMRPKTNPYGDGNASVRIVDFLIEKEFF